MIHKSINLTWTHTEHSNAHSNYSLWKTDYNPWILILDFPVINKKQVTHILARPPLSVMSLIKNRGCNNPWIWILEFKWIKIVHRNMCKVEHKHIPQMSLGVSLFTTCGIYFQSTRRPEPNSLFSKNTRPTVMHPGSQNKNPELPQSGSVSWTFWCSANNRAVKITAQWSYTVYKRRKITPN